MTLSATDLDGLDYALDGMPFGDGTTTEVGLGSLDYALDGMPFGGNPGATDYDKTYSLKLSTYVDYDRSFTMKLQLASPVQAAFTLPMHASNVMKPTYIVNGVYVFQNEETDPGGDISNILEYIKLDSIIAGTEKACVLSSFTLDLTYDGGSFSIVSDTPFGSEGDTLTVMGIPCFITRAGERLSSSVQGYTTKGIVGMPGINKQLVFAAYGNPYLTPILPTQRLVLASSENWTTCSVAAQAIASVAGLDIDWHVRDFPLTDFLPENGTKVIEALRSIATRAGGILRFDGVNRYSVVYPDVAYYEFELPSCKVIGPGGVGYERIFDIETGLSGVGSQMLSQYRIYDASRTPLPNGTDVKNTPTSPQVQPIGKNKKFLTSADAADVFDLPANYDKVYIQHLVPTFTNGSAPGVIGQNFCTTDESRYFELSQYAGYVFQANVGGAYIPKVRLDWTLYAEENTDLSKQHFTTTLYCTLKSRSGAGAAESDARQRESVGYDQEPFRFIRTYEADLQVLIFGALPIPGMCIGTPAFGQGVLGGGVTGGVTIGPDDPVNYPNQHPITVGGIIESVHVSLPGYINIELVNFKRLSMLGSFRTATAQ